MLLGNLVLQSYDGLAASAKTGGNARELTKTACTKAGGAGTSSCKTSDGNHLAKG
jgi:hypothetical protein